MTITERSHDPFCQIRCIFSSTWWDALQVLLLAGDARNYVQVGRKAAPVLVQRSAPTGNKSEIRILPCCLAAQPSCRIFSQICSWESFAVSSVFGQKENKSERNAFLFLHLLTPILIWISGKMKRETERKLIYSRFLKVDGASQHTRLPTRLLDIE